MFTLWKEPHLHLNDPSWSFSTVDGSFTNPAVNSPVEVKVVEILPLFTTGFMIHARWWFAGFLNHQHHHYFLQNISPASPDVNVNSPTVPETSWNYITSRWWFQTCIIFIPILGKIPISTNIFQMGWKHQSDIFAPKEREMRTWLWGKLSLIFRGLGRITETHPPKKIQPKINL